MLLYPINVPHQIPSLLLPHIVLPLHYKIFGLWVPFQEQKTVIITEKIDVALLVLPIVRKEFGVEPFGSQFGFTNRGKTGPVVPLQQFSVDLQLSVHPQIELLVLLTIFILVDGFAFGRAEYLIGPTPYRRFAYRAFFVIGHK